MASGGGDLLPCVQTLAENSQDVFMQTSEVILRILRNVIKDPKNPKYRKLRVSTSVFMDKLLPVDGAMDCLLSLGFQEDGDFFSLPDNVPSMTLHLMKDQLEMQQRVYQGTAPKPSPAPPAPRAPASGATAAPPPTPAVQPTHNDKLKHPALSHPLLQMQMNFFKKLESGMQTVLAYEDSMLQSQAQQHMPLEQLRDRAALRLNHIAEEEGSKIGLPDILLLELLAWFKMDFFQWVDAPQCDSCRGPTVSVGMAEPMPAELLWGAHRVENYRCEKCGQFTRFPRYNHPGMLLETRRGRCGEWANCFTLCCRAAGFEARYVLDWTDHVWTEVYSDAQGRWLHCDPCENTCDKPLTYEAGWGKKLTYVMAFSKDEIQDVTWRYSAQHEAVRARRKEVSESWLLLTMSRMRERFWASLSPPRREAIKQRLVIELIGFMTVKGATREELTGRVSGSMAWRQVRGETGPAQKTKAKLEPTVITPNQQEIGEKLVHLRYSSAIDKYMRGRDAESVVSGWEKMVHHAENVFRKEEADWKMSYLARTEGTDSATISWKFDFTEYGLVVDEVDVTAEDSRYENGQVVWRVCGDDACAFLPPGGARSVLSDLAGSRTVTLTAHLKGGVGDCAWQHTQLFRQKLTDDHLYPFNVRITLKEQEEGKEEKEGREGGKKEEEGN